MFAMLLCSLDLFRTRFRRPSRRLDEWFALSGLRDLGWVLYLHRYLALEYFKKHSARTREKSNGLPGHTDIGFGGVLARPFPSHIKFFQVKAESFERAGW
jgi:hypothetical protein